MDRTQYISYIDTDSLFIRLREFLNQQGITDKQWLSIDEDNRIEILLEISKIIENNVNDRSFDETQCVDYNSRVERDDFSIIYKQEIVCSRILHIKSKMYAYHVVNDEGIPSDDISAKGIETVRSNSPKVFRSGLKDILEIILKSNINSIEPELKIIIPKLKDSFLGKEPVDVSINIGANNLKKYIRDDFTCRLKTPYQVKGVANYQILLEELGITHKYEPIKEGDKIKVVYLKPNKYNLPVISYYEWPQEFNKVINVDYETMIEKYFVNKLGIFLDPIDKLELLTQNDLMDEFF